MVASPWKVVTLVSDDGSPLRTVASSDPNRRDLVVALTASEIEIGHVVIKNDTTEDHVTVAPDGTAVGGPDYPDIGFAVMGNDGTTWRVFNTDAAGNLVSVGSPGSTITNSADVAIGIGATVILPAPPAGTRRMLVQNTTTATRLRFRESGGVAGSGFLAAFLGFREYGGGDGAVATVEAEHVAGPASTAHIEFEG